MSCTDDQLLQEQTTGTSQLSFIEQAKRSAYEKFFSLSPRVRLNILAILVGIVAGFGSWVFRLTIDFSYYIFFVFPQDTFESMGLSGFNWLPFLVVPIVGGIAVGILITKVSRETKGHGVPEVMEAVALHGGKMSIRVPFIKIIASAITIGSGGSAGREGPIAQIGAGFASLIGQKLDLSQRELRTLVVAGVGAGISAIFNAPIGGTLFAVEVLLRGSSISLFIPIIVASVVGTVTAQFLFKSEPVLSFPTLEYQNANLIPLFIILGILAGVTAAFWIKSFYKIEDLLESTFERVKIPEFLQPAVGGVFFGSILVITFIFAGNEWEAYTTMGLTYVPMENVFNGILTTGAVEVVVAVLIILFILKLVSTGFTIGTGGSGGIFAPTLFLGVMFGAIFGVIAREFYLISHTQVAVFALLGMAAVFAGTSRTPLTAIIMTAEMTGDYFLTIPLMFAVSFSWLVASHLQPEDIYLLKLTRRGTKIYDISADVLETINVSEAMTPREKLTTVDYKMRIEAVLDLIRTAGHEGFPVFRDNEFVSVITLSDVQDALQEHPKEWNVGDVIENKKTSLVCIDTNATLAHAVAIMVRRDISRLPVVKKCDDGKPELLGWITHHDITRKYMEKQASQALEETEKHILSY
ncbi:MAG: chloride channel protein [Candidatus Odinarchaeota archaeon]